MDGAAAQARVSKGVGAWQEGQNSSFAKFVTATRFYFFLLFFILFFRIFAGQVLRPTFVVAEKPQRHLLDLLRARSRDKESGQKGRMSDGHAYSYTLRFIVFARCISAVFESFAQLLSVCSFYLRAFRFLFFMAYTKSWRWTGGVAYRAERDREIKPFEANGLANGVVAV